jgi:hypothetical protein
VIITSTPDGHAGAVVTILKIFSPKNLAKMLAFFLKTKLNFEKFDHNIDF